MSHNLFGERFLGYRKPGWHNLGEVIDDELSASEAITRARCDYRVFKSPVCASIPADAQGLFGDAPFVVDVPERYVITREPTNDDNEYKFFGFVSPQYEVLDNLEIGYALDTLADDMHVETVGALNDGATLFISFDAGEIQLVPNSDEVIHQYFLFTEHKDGHRKARFSFTPVRVVCQNTLTMSERQSTVNAEISHNTGASAQLTLRIDMLAKLMSTKEHSIEALRRLANVEISNDDAITIINRAYPMPAAANKITKRQAKSMTTNNDLANELFDVSTRKARGVEQRIAQMQSYRDGAYSLFEQINDEHPAIARTPYAAFNAVAELADWRDGRGDIEYSALFGSRAKEKQLAYVEALKYA